MSSGPFSHDADQVRPDSLFTFRHTCDVEKTEIVLGNTGSFELDKKIEPFGCHLNYLCDMRVPS